jgi:hypothetical protein
VALPVVVPFTPAYFLPKAEERPGIGIGGGGGGGLTPNPIRGISIAFGSSANAEAPLWQNLRELGE